MTTRSRTLLLVAVFVALFLTLWLVLACNCPSAGIALTSRAARLHRIKNRTAFPQAADFDARVTLEALLQPGDDTHRWSNDRAARIQGHVVDVAYARPEATNCFSPWGRDIHINVATHKGAAKSELVVLEVTPKLRAWAAAQGMDWSAETLHAQLVGHWCEFEGWLYLDVGHIAEAENTSPGNPENWRATGWEIHPITKITVLR